MQFQVPLFIERESKIVGPLTFKQFLYLAVAGVVIVIMRTFGLPVFLFLVLTVILIIIALLLAFLNVGGRTLPQILTNLFAFFVSSKIFIWQRKQFSPKFVERIPRLKKEEVEETPTLKIAEKSRLKKLSSEIETRLRHD